MRNLIRMSAASGLLMVAVTFAPKPVEASCLDYCWLEGDCYYCVNECTGRCTYSTCPWTGAC